MKLISSEDGIDFFLFKPSLFRLYFENRTDDAVHRHTISHVLHMYAYLFWGGYSILYLSQNDEIVSYFIFTKCKDWIVNGSGEKDYYTIFLWTYPKHRNKGLATTMARFVLQKTGLEFEHFYKTIAKDNYSSIAVAEKCGFIKVGEANKVGLMHRIIPAEKGSCLFYRYTV